MGKIRGMKENVGGNIPWDDVWARPGVFPQQVWTSPKKGQKKNQIFRGRTEISPGIQGVPVVGVSTEEGGQRRPAPSFSTPAGGWKLLTGKHWGSLVKSSSEEEKKRKKKKELNSTDVGCAPISAWLVNYNISWSVNVVFLYLGSEGVKWGTATSSKMRLFPA